MQIIKKKPGNRSNHDNNIVKHILFFVQMLEMSILRFYANIPSLNQFLPFNFEHVQID